MATKQIAKNIYCFDCRCVCKIMISCGKFLVEPNLPATEELTSLNLHKVMKSSKTIYLQPDSNIIWQPTAPIEVVRNLHLTKRMSFCLCNKKEYE